MTKSNKLEKKPMKWLKTTLIILAMLLGTAILVVVVRFGNYFLSLMSIKRINNDCVYSMTYYGDYYFDDFVEQGGAKSSKEISDFLRNKFTEGIPDFLIPNEFSCSAFMAQSPNGDVLVGRNFDYEFAPAIVVKTHAKSENASISVADGAF